MKNCKHCGEKHTLRGNKCRVCKDGIYRYKLNRTEQLKLLESQNCKCALCEKELELFQGREGGFIDHCHATGKVRGILCNRCNTVVGGLENKSIGDIDKILSYIFPPRPN